jgi:sugar-specific transcriptional regulator TrmB
MLPDFIREQLGKPKCFRILSASNWENRNASGFCPRAIGKTKVLPDFVREQLGKPKCFRILSASNWENPSAS